VLIAGDDPVHCHAVGRQLFSSLQRAFLDRDPEGLFSRPSTAISSGRRVSDRPALTVPSSSGVHWAAHWSAGSVRPTSAGGKRFHARGRGPELVDIVFSDCIGAGQHPSIRRHNPTDDVVVQADGRVVALERRDPGRWWRRSRLPGRTAWSHPRSRRRPPTPCRLAGVLDCRGCPEGTARRHIDACQIGIGIHEVLRLGVGYVTLVAVLSTAPTTWISG